MANNRKKSKGRKFNYQPKMVTQKSPFGDITVPSNTQAKKVVQTRLEGKTHNSRDY